MSMALSRRSLTRRSSSTWALRRALAETSGHYGRGSAPSVRDLLAPLGTGASALAAALLALPFLSPVSMGVITMPASVLIALLGWQLLRQREGSPLPDRFLDVSVPHAAHRAMTAVLRRADRWMHRISRPRLVHLIEGRRGRILCGAGIVVGAVLLAVPIPLLPLTNTFPALAILLFSLGWLERDGMLTVLGSVALTISVALFATLGFAVMLLGWEAVQGAVPLLGRD